MSESAPVIESLNKANNGAAAPSEGDVAVIDELRTTYNSMKSEMAKVIVGQDEVVERLLIAILSRGHALLMGVPGLAKTLMVNSLSRVMSLDFNRIQFTPDLMPSDITGTDILQETAEGRREFEFVKGPIFANIILADEINRAPPKTQSALLEAMAERQVTHDGITETLSAPFFVIATQNPADLQGTFPLPENQLDRFALKLSLHYLNPIEEIRLFNPFSPKPKKRKTLPAINKAEVIELMEKIGKIEISNEVKLYAANLVAASRTHSQIALGGSPRATFSTLRCGQALAYFDDASVVNPDHITELFPYIIKHRLRLDDSGFTTDSEKDQVVEDIIEGIEPPL